jgi:hypothetical protein
MLLITLIVLWASLVALVVLHRSLAKSWRIIVVGLLLGYGAACAATLYTSYAANRDRLAGFDERRAIAHERFDEIVRGGPDSLAGTPVMVAAKRLQRHVDRAANDYSPGTWRVVWHHGVLPAFDGGVAARNILALVEGPPLIAFAKVQRDRHIADLIACMDEHNSVFPMGLSQTIKQTDRVLLLGASMHVGVMRLVDSVDIAREHIDDPRTGVAVLAGLPHRMVGVEAKVEELLQVGCDRFDQFTVLKVARSTMIDEAEVGEWRPCSPLFIDIEYLLPMFIGLNDLEARWIGDPPRPVIGTADAIFEISMEVIGPWPPSQGTWTDAESGKTGPVFATSAKAYRYNAPGLEMVKWANQPDFRVVEIAQNTGYLGFPTVRVHGSLLFRPGDKGFPR